MRKTVRDAFWAFSIGFEGYCTWMYLDTAAPPGPFVTTGVGNLIDPIALALELPWYWTDGRPANHIEVGDEWHSVKNMVLRAPQGGVHFKKWTSLRLREEDVKALVQRKLEWHEKFLLHRVPAFEAWPADAQLGLLSMSWALGPGFRWPLFELAAKHQDWMVCAQECGIRHNKPRSDAQKKLFENAAIVVRRGLDWERLWYPHRALEVP